MSSGSDRRQRHVTLSARFSPEEAAAVRAAADRAGVTVASLIRATVLEQGPALKPTRQPPVARAMLSHMLHALGPVADNLRRIADRPDIGRDDPALATALAELGDLSFACLQAIGRGRTRPRSRAVPAESPRFDAGQPGEALAGIFARAVFSTGSLPPLSADFARAVAGVLPPAVLVLTEGPAP